MIQVRYKIFETNSSSACTLSVSIIQIDNLDIPSTIQIDSSSNVWDHDINARYALAKRDEREQDFLDLLANAGVKQIYVDGVLKEANPENHTSRSTKDFIDLAISFGDYFNYSEWHSWGGEIDSWNPPLSLASIKNIQIHDKDPDYMIYCTDGEDGEIDWHSLPYSTMTITNEDIQKDELYRNARSEAEKQRLLEERELLDEAMYKYALEQMDYEERIKFEEESKKYESPYDYLTDYYKNKPLSHSKKKRGR